MNPYDPLPSPRTTWLPERPILLRVMRWGCTGICLLFLYIQLYVTVPELRIGVFLVCGQTLWVLWEGGKHFRLLHSLWKQGRTQELWELSILFGILLFAGSWLILFIYLLLTGWGGGRG